jgi:hypothetical protein
MDDRKRQALLAGRRAQGFLNARADEIRTVMSPSLREKLDDAVARLAAFEDQQLGSTKTAIGETAVQKQLRENISYRFLQAISNTAKVEKLNDPRLIIYARINNQSQFLEQLDALVAALPAYESVMTKAGLGPEFVGRLNTAIDELKASTESRDRHWGKRSGATKGLEEANKAVRDRLGEVDRMLMGWLKGNPSLKADWKASSKIHRARIEPRRGGSVELPPDDEKPT